MSRSNVELYMCRTCYQFGSTQIIKFGKIKDALLQMAVIADQIGGKHKGKDKLIGSE